MIDCPFPHGDLIAWHERWTERLAREPQDLEACARQMRDHNPAVIPRNHKVEEALAAATDHGDLQVMHRLLDFLNRWLVPFLTAVGENPYMVAIRNGMGESPARNTRATANQTVPSVERSVWQMQKR